MRKQTTQIKSNKIKLELADKLRKEILDSISRSYEDEYAFSYLMLDIPHQLSKFNSK